MHIHHNKEYKLILLSDNVTEQSVSNLVLHRVVTKISSCQVNTTSRRGIKWLGISFGSIIVLFSNKSSRGNPRPPALNDNPVYIIVYFYLYKEYKTTTYICIMRTDCRQLSPAPSIFLVFTLGTLFGHFR